MDTANQSLMTRRDISRPLFAALHSPPEPFALACAAPRSPPSAGQVSQVGLNLALHHRPVSLRVPLALGGLRIVAPSSATLADASPLLYAAAPD